MKRMAISAMMLAACGKSGTSGTSGTSGSGSGNAGSGSSIVDVAQSRENDPTLDEERLWAP